MCYGREHTSADLCLTLSLSLCLCACLSRVLCLFLSNFIWQHLYIPSLCLLYLWPESALIINQYLKYVPAMVWTVWWSWLPGSTQDLTACSQSSFIPWLTLWTRWDNCLSGFDCRYNLACCWNIWVETDCWKVLTEVQGRQYYFSKFVGGKTWHVSFNLDVCKQISVRLCALLAVFSLKSSVLLWTTWPFIQDHSRMKQPNLLHLLVI